MEGRVPRSPLLSSSIKIGRLMWWVHRNFTPVNRQMIAKHASSKRVVHLRSVGELNAFRRSVLQADDRQEKA
jgi:hypothetical protein